MEKIFETFNDFINEGVYDKNIFKAILLAGGPGSGKSYVAEKVTFADKLADRFPMSSLGLKFISSDIPFEYHLKKEGIPMDLDKLKTENPVEYERAMEIRSKAKRISETQFDLLLKGRIGLVIDGTGRDFNKIKGIGDNFDSLGYDKIMIFVNTSLDVALHRNSLRERKVSEDEARKMWKQVQDNIGKFQRYFGKERFIFIDNNSYASEDYLMEINKEIRSFLREPIKNEVAQEWIDKEMEIKKRK